VAPAMPTAGAAEASPKAAEEGELTTNEFTDTTGKKGLHALDDADLFNILVIPPYDANGDIDSKIIDTAAGYCEGRRAMLLIDAPTGWNDAADGVAAVNGAGIGTTSKNAALFFPRYFKPNADQIPNFPVSGAVAGVFARTDATRGVWKAPA